MKTNWLIQERRIQAFLQCWDEMQHNKQTCGFCVDSISLDHNNIPESVYNGNIEESDANQSKQEEVKCEHPFHNQNIEETGGCPFCGARKPKQQVNEQPKDNGLREAAEKVVLKWIEKCAITAEDIEKLQKALK
jgi:hypothetical protein